MANLLRRSAALLLSTLALAASAATPPAQVATQLLDHLQAGDGAAAVAMFTPEMASAAPAPGLLALWRSFGEPRGRGAAEVISTSERPHVVTQPLQFAAGTVAATVVVDAQGRIAGLFFKPAEPAAPPVPADARYREVPLDIVTAGGPLPGLLARPHGGTAPLRAVVLVHGSGPQDRDETIGANRPFLDVARGLAAHGIAVLRYDKRTRVRPQAFSGDAYTMDDETTHDAVAAVATLAAQAGIDPRHVYVMGHSQGGMLAPRIARQSGKVAGLVLWAAPARSLLTLLPEQNRYLLGLDGRITPDEQAFLDTLDRQIAAARSDAPVAPADLPLRQPASYWRAFDAIDPVADARASPLPMLLLQGGRDFQVTETDWQLWQRGLSGRRNASFQHYPALNHLGIAGDGPGSLQEYSQPGHVLPALIDDVAAWIGAQP
ncbi:alpha/beta fold hydrolase [Stenotrophomonas sp. BIGb0135]|uniref:alpha/beta hydrolase n=1 Tax=Stenotrophomonas sp. BIGb0135 TaxID=2940620 RepID=UPI002166E3D6|nr:alpha/beta fold hydrolase [Stenotrophomonas sp. BIGb0135]MCS4233940.1 dienelactone hydrolase [Stenotrophomonas sp. BIGb0135]